MDFQNINIFRLMNINKKLREFAFYISKLEQRVEALEAGTSAVTVQTDEQIMDEREEEEITEEAPVPEPTDEELRDQAQKAGVKSWHVKSIDKLRAELSELED